MRARAHVVAGAAHRHFFYFPTNLLFSLVGRPSRLAGGARPRWGVRVCGGSTRPQPRRVRARRARARARARVRSGRASPSGAGRGGGRRAPRLAAATGRDRRQRAATAARRRGDLAASPVPFLPLVAFTMSSRNRTAAFMRYRESARAHSAGRRGGAGGLHGGAAESSLLSAAISSSSIRTGWRARRAYTSPGGRCRRRGSTSAKGSRPTWSASSRRCAARAPRLAGGRTARPRSPARGAGLPTLTRLRSCAPRVRPTPPRSHLPPVTFSLPSNHTTQVAEPGARTRRRCCRRSTTRRRTVRRRNSHAGGQPTVQARRIGAEAAGRRA